LTNILKKHLKDSVTDIFIIGSSLKNKLSPNDLDILVLFKDKIMKDVEERLFNIKEDLGFIKSVHIEPIFVDSMFKESIFLTAIHEGFSIKENKFVHELLKMDAYCIFSYSLENLSKIDKVRFAQALYGRKKDGLLYKEKAVYLGQGSFMVLVDKEEIFKELFKEWKVNYDRRKAFINH
jgi:predicted nucleotidyltransferase